MPSSCKAKVIKLESTERYQRLLDKDSGSLGIKAGHVILKPGENVGEHTTAEREELVIILKGSGEAAIDRQDILKIANNAILYIPPETTHDIKNTGSNNLEYIFLTSRAHTQQK